MVYLLYTAIAITPKPQVVEGAGEVYSNSKYLANFVHGVNLKTCKEYCSSWKDRCQDLCKSKKACALSETEDARHFTRDESCSKECVGFNMHGDDACTLFADGYELLKGGRGQNYVMPGEDKPGLEK